MSEAEMIFRGLSAPPSAADWLALADAVETWPARPGDAVIDAANLNGPVFNLAVRDPADGWLAADVRETRAVADAAGGADWRDVIQSGRVQLKSTSAGWVSVGAVDLAEEADLAAAEADQVIWREALTAAEREGLSGPLAELAAERALWNAAA